MQKAVANFIAEYNLNTDAQTRYIDLVSEIGELGKEILTSTDYGKNGFTPNPKMLDEIGDCLFSFFAMCHEMKIDAEGALNKSLSKYEQRFADKGDVGSMYTEEWV